MVGSRLGGSRASVPAWALRALGVTAGGASMPLSWILWGFYRIAELLDRGLGFFVVVVCRDDEIQVGHLLVPCPSSLR